jgi:hypothetical protein
MEPIHPEVREELKRVYPGLTDETIDRYEELTALRFTVDPDEGSDELRRIDIERARFVSERMPRFAEIENAVLSKVREAARRQRQPPDVRLRKEDEPRGP